MNYPWYTVIEQKNDIHQGDFIINCPVVIPPAVFDLKNTTDVDFKNVYGIHRSTLNGIIKNLKTRIRLLPPYREHLSQAFARYFMRVGLPQDIAIEGY